MLGVGALTGISPKGRLDMGPFATDLVNRYRGLAKGVEVLPEYPISRLVIRIKQLTHKNMSVLVPLEYKPQILFWAERPMSGILPIYAHGMLDNYEWRMRNLKAVRAYPPAIVVVQPGMLSPDTDNHSVCRRNPELCAFLAKHYRHVAYRQGDEYVILTPNTE